MQNLQLVAKEIRKRIFRAAYRGKSGHLGSAFSIVEVLTSLYFTGVLEYDKANPLWQDRDKLIMSKGHANLALYSVFSMIGYLTEEELMTYCQPGSRLGGEPKLGDVNGVEATTGSLGHGLSFGVGIAMANKLDNRSSRVYVILGDGECQEGSVWEAAICAGHYKLDNLTVILDSNKLQAMDSVSNILSLNPIIDKWRSFGFEVAETDGHSIDLLTNVFMKDKKNNIEKPRLIIVNTIKGKGVSFMENVPIWHYRMPNEQEIQLVMKELNISQEELLS